MNEKEKLQEIKNILDINLNMIQHCDIKASIALATLCAFLSIILTNGPVGECVSFVKESKNEVLLLIICILTLLCIAAGIYFLLSVLFARIGNSGFNSTIYFHDISVVSHEEYKTRFDQQTIGSLSDDYLRQVHINSKICINKHNRFNLGIILSCAGSIFLIVVMLCFTW